MAIKNDDSNIEESILYELLEYFVRKQEPELIKCKNDTVILPTSGTIKNALLYLNKRYSLPESISQYVSLTLPWKFTIGDGGRLLAILQENVLEIRRLKDEYSSVIGKASVFKDVFPQWRKLTWSPDGSILALSSSSGYVSFYNSLGNTICEITSHSVTHNPDILEAGEAVVAMIFKKPNVKTEKWDYEFIKITYGGVLSSYYISSTNGYHSNHSFRFGNYYKNGITAVSYSQQHNLFFVAGNGAYESSTRVTSEAGLTAWRQLNDYPYYKLSTAFEEDIPKAQRFSLWNYIPTVRPKPQTIIFKMSISPSGQTLACIHTDGTVSIWCTPNLQLQKQWKLSEQPNYNIRNPLNVTKYRRYPPTITEFHPLDVGWWSDQALVIARYSGAISICSIKNLKNLLGPSPEFLFGPVHIVESSAVRGVLCLDCEIYITSTKRSSKEDEGHTSETSVESDKENGESESMPVLNYATNLFQSALYSITDIEKFQPKRRKSRIFHRTYRILGLKSTTPEELYSRKIEIEEYEEALTLAKTYNLDMDLVYQTQWRKSQFSLNAIHEHLSKVSKRSWVLNECVSRVPDNLVAAKELLMFGLRETDLQILLATGTDDNFISLETEDTFTKTDNINTSLLQAQKINAIIQRLDVSKFTDAQKDLIKFRRKLLQHMDMLNTYEILLESQSKYSKDFYQEFRQMSTLENAVRFAKDGNCEGVIIMFTYFGNELMQHWLPIISFFPETLDPTYYKKLLPRCDSKGQLYLLDQQELRQKDWSERIEFNEIMPLQSHNNDTMSLIYKDNPWFIAYRNTTLTPELLRDWYKHRSYEIEQYSRLVDNALLLVNIGKCHNISGLETLIIELETLNDLVYKVGLEDISLIELDKLSDLKKIELLMSQVNESNFVKHVNDTLLPFAKKKQMYMETSVVKQLLHDYFVLLSEDNLHYIVELYQYLSKVTNSELYNVIGDIHGLAFECIYHCKDSNMYSNARDLFSIISNEFDDEEIEDYNDTFENLERELECLEILNKYGVNIPLNYLKDNKKNVEAIGNLLLQICETVKNSESAVKEKSWTQLLMDLTHIQEALSDMDVNYCSEIYLSTRLKSGIKSIIQKSKSLITTENDYEDGLFTVSYEKVVDLILDACDEYFNNAKSLTDPNMELAKTCLHLIETDDNRIKEEFDFINALEILNEFNLNVLPLQVKLTQNKIKLIEDCLKNQNDSYKYQYKLLTLAKYLRIDKNSRTQEGKVLTLIAQRAFEVEDYDACGSIIQHLIEINYQNSWIIALKLGRCDNYKNLIFRRYCLWFVIDTGPNDLIEETIKYLNLLETEILDADLKKWMLLKNESFESEFGNGRDLTDAVNEVPKGETKNMIPKILETSSKLMKNSTLVVTQSMIDMIKNRDFWSENIKSYLTCPEDLMSEKDNDNEQGKSGIVQSLPCFYESLHNSVKFSNLDTKYTSYSMPDTNNIELNLCQILLRVQMSKESSSYGKDTSDINQLLIECARNTLDEDCLLSLGYLLSLKDEYIFNVTKMFENLPQTEMHAQFAAFFYALKLLKHVDNICNDVTLYDPLKVIQVVEKKVNKIDKCNEFTSLLKDKLQLGQFTNASNESSKAETYLENDIDTQQKMEDEGEGNIKVKDKPTSLTLTATKSEPHTITEDDEWNDKWNDTDWEDFSSNTVEDHLNVTDIKEVELCNKSETKMESQPQSEKDRYQMFEDMFSKIETKESYIKVKKMLQSWPLFTESTYVCSNKNPVLKMIMKITQVIDKRTANYEIEVMQEFQDLLKRQTISKEILEEFFKNERDRFSTEQQMYLKLLSGECFYTEVVDTIKEKYKELNLTAIILEELFFRNLTPHFSPTHHLYYRILEEVFFNRTIPEIQENIEILIEKLVQQKNIPHAVALLNQLECIPPSLSTYDSCFQRLLKK